MKRPTPYQARVLIHLRDQDEIIFTCQFPNVPLSIGFVKGYEMKRALQQKTFLVLIKNGWIHTSDRIGFEDNRPIKTPLKFPYSYYEISPAGIKAVKGYTPPENKVKVSDKIITGKMLDALKNKYCLDEWAFIEEISVSTGFSPQRLDGFAINCWPMNKYRSIAFEIKASRGDFLTEIKSPAKRLQGMAISNQFFFVAPWGMIKKEEIPEGCGLLEYRDPRDLITTKRSTITTADSPSWWLLASITRRYARAHKELTTGLS